MLMESAISELRARFASRGYLPIETPLIEHSELFLRMSGGLLSTQIFDFIGPDGSTVSIRPELTAPIIRHSLHESSPTFPQRYQYAAPIVRYSERPYEDPPRALPRRRQFTQIGAELIGPDHPAADGEVIAMATDAAEEITRFGIAIRIGHVGVIWSLLEQFQISQRARLFIASNLAALKGNPEQTRAVQQQAARLGMLASLDQREKQLELIRKLRARAISLPQDDSHSLRSTQEIAERLKKNLCEPHDPKAFSAAIEFISHIVTLSAAPDEALERTESIIQKHGLQVTEEVKNLCRVVGATIDEGVEEGKISVDLGFSTGIEYYTGMIFNVSARRAGQQERIGGGGRYDRLAKALGSDTDIPALGFALSLEKMLEFIEEEPIAKPNSNLIVLAPTDDSASPAIAGRAAELRCAGFQVASMFKALTSAQAESIKKQMRPSKIMAVSEDGATREIVQ